MLNFSRRQFLAASAAGLAAGSLSGCATGTKNTLRRKPPAQSALQLLFYADTHAQ